MTVYFVVLLIGHFIGDFYLQSKRLLELKSEKISFLLLHVSIYTLCLLPGIISTLSVGKIFMAIAFIGGTHLILDYLKMKINPKDNLQDLVTFIVDQALHIFVIYVVFEVTKTSIPIQPIYNYLFYPFIQYYDVIDVAQLYLIFLIISVPSSILIEKTIISISPKSSINNTESFYSKIETTFLLSQKNIDSVVIKQLTNYVKLNKIKPSVANYLLFTLISQNETLFLYEKFVDLYEQMTNDNISSFMDMEKRFNPISPFSGNLIGVLERIVIILLGLLNLWQAIALVFTAKSIARFKQLEEKTFAQKYLIGTLISFIIALLCLIIIK